MREVTRRGVLAGAAASLASPAWGEMSPPLRRIALGSCGRQNKEQPIWDSVLAAEPDLFLFLGDNVYGDTTDSAELRAKYARLAANDGFKRLKARIPLLATWDDHDYGTNDCGVEHPGKEESRAAFCDFWEEPSDSSRRSSPNGIFTSRLIGPPGQDVLVILPDLRWNRTKLRRPGGFPLVAASFIGHHVAPMAQVRGPYFKTRREEATILGAAQWAWLEAELLRPAALTIIGSSIQVLAEGGGWEAWENFPAERARLLALIGARRDVLLLSGDVHYAEISRLERKDAAPLWELTSSGITESSPLLKNRNRVAAKSARNFGLVGIDWETRTLTLEARSESGAELFAERTSFA